MQVEKLQYFSIGADVIEEKCKDVTFVFNMLGKTKPLIGNLFSLDGDPLALRLRALDGEVYKVSCPVDVYPSLGVITHRNAYQITLTT
jgi:hypothetical protein